MNYFEKIFGFNPSSSSSLSFFASSDSLSQETLSETSQLSSSSSSPESSSSSPSSSSSLSSWLGSSTTSVVWSLKMILIIMISFDLLIMAQAININSGQRDIRDDDCLGIAMRPLPRFGKRNYDADLNQETVARFRRSCIINRRQSKADKQFLRTDEQQLQQQQQQQQQPNQYQNYFGRLGTIADFPSTSAINQNYVDYPVWWKHLMGQLIAQKNRNIIEKLIMNHFIDQSISNLANGGGGGAGGGNVGVFGTTSGTTGAGLGAIIANDGGGVNDQHQIPSPTSTTIKFKSIF